MYLLSDLIITHVITRVNRKYICFYTCRKKRGEIMKFDALFWIKNLCNADDFS